MKKPAHKDTPNGVLTIRTTVSTHKELKKEAAKEGVSLNHYVAQIFASRHSRK